MGKIAAEVNQAVARRRARGEAGVAAGTRLAGGAGWSVDDVLCSSGPEDRPFEEEHRGVSIGVVVAGSFQYRSAGGRVLLSPGAMLLGNHRQRFECDHEHAAGDRCVAFRFHPGIFEQIAADAGVPAGERRFRRSRLPPLAVSAAPVAAAALALGIRQPVGWDEMAVEIAGTAARLAAALPAESRSAPAAMLARVTRTIRAMARAPGEPRSLHRLAEEAGLSPWHYLRAFRQATGTTPHQFLLRARLRAAALRLAAEEVKIISIALESGFGDISSFNRAFRREFGMTPGAYRTRFRRLPSSSSG